MTNDQVRAEFHRLFLEWMCNDLDSGIRGKANYLVALGLFSYLEVLGGMVNGRGGLRERPGDNFEEAVKLLPQPYQDLNQKIVVHHPDQADSGGLYGVFRCGLAHEYSPKGLAVVVNDPGRTEEPHEGIKADRTPEGHPYVAVFNNALLRDFKAAAEAVCKRLEADEEPLMSNVRKVFGRVANYTASW